MTIYHPRVGFEISTVAAAGTDSTDAASLALAVGKTLALVLPKSGASGTDPGGIALQDTDVGNTVEFWPISDDGHVYSENVKIYFPSGHSYYVLGGTGSNNGPITFAGISAGGAPLTLVKVDTTKWTVW